MKNFKNYLKKYHFENGDVQAVLALSNAIIMICCNSYLAPLGLSMGGIGIYNDIKYHHKINSYIMNLSGIAIGIYRILQF